MKPVKPLTALDVDQFENIWRFAHQAMHTRFEIWITHEDGIYAEQAAQDAFQLLDDLEQNLSRFIPNSDISRLNQAPANQPVQLDENTLHCLFAAKYISEISNRTFDITVGSLLEAQLDSDCIGMKHFNIDSNENTVTKSHDGLRIDLGGIGKGFAVDRMTDQLQEWDIENVLIHGGASSVKAVGHPDGHEGWPVQISHPESGEVLSRFELHNESMGASGLEKGAHIIDPRNGQPASHHQAVWARGPTATEMDGLSTAFMILNPKQIETIIQNHSDRSAWIIDAEGRNHQFGNWKDQ